ncbi:MAG: OmpA family protein, partial [Gemmatimonadetes bacterium]|nr:OmpA family protein [Gemmatimonadota bacterium]
MEKRLKRIAMTLIGGIALMVAGCGGLNQEVLNTEIAGIRAEMLGGDAALAQRIDAGDARVGQLEERVDVLGVMSGRVENLDQELQSTRREFNTDIQELQNAVRFNSPVHFDYDSDSIRVGDRELLDRFANIVGTYYPIATVTIEGFTDPAGDAEYNRALGERRANVVKQYLLAQGLVEQRV